MKRLRISQALLLMALGLLWLPSGCRPPDVRSYHTLERALRQGKVSPNTPVAEVLALGSPQDTSRVGPFLELTYGYHRPDRSAAYHRIELFAYRGRLLSAYDLSSAQGSGDTRPGRVKLFDVTTPALRQRFSFLGARKGCAGPPESPGECLSLARHHRDGVGTKRDLQKARWVLEGRCQRGAFSHDDQIHCATLARWLLAGKLGPVDTKAAKRFAARACRLGYRRACAR